MSLQLKGFGGMFLIVKMIRYFMIRVSAKQLKLIMKGDVVDQMDMDRLVIYLGRPFKDIIIAKRPCGCLGVINHTGQALKIPN